MERYKAHCAWCQTTKDLMMYAHRHGGKMVGWIFVCPQCAPDLENGQLEIRITPSVEEKYNA